MTAAGGWDRCLRGPLAEHCDSGGNPYQVLDMLPENRPGLEGQDGSGDLNDKQSTEIVDDHSISSGDTADSNCEEDIVDAENGHTLAVPDVNDPISGDELQQVQGGN